jgi:HD-GYP domain-containing protein (c-di-GMP phosphodiesterase class II)
MSLAAALAHLQRGSATQFHPLVVRAAAEAARAGTLRVAGGSSAEAQAAG